MLKLRSPLGLSATGVGPTLLLSQLPLLAAAVFALRRWPAATRLPFEPSLFVRVLGGAWLASGIALWAMTLLWFLRGFPSGKLIVDGPYRYCRHPLYASLFVFVMPGASLLLHTWTILVAALAGAALTWALVAREESELEQAFAAEWRAYRKRTSRLLPLPPNPGLPRSLATVFWSAVTGFCVYIERSIGDVR